ncbi:MAG: YifB family Mg chelatase-like AAA ATPase [Limnochordia bacterium]
MLAQVGSLALNGLDARTVMVEVDLTNGLPLFNIVGLPDTSIRESRNRVRSGLRNSGYEFPVRRITVNLAPADMPKVGAAFDLPIALGIMAAAGQIPAHRMANVYFVGEMALDGRLRAGRGAVCLASACLGQDALLVMPSAAEAELQWIPEGSHVRLAGHLREVVDWLRHGGELRSVHFCSSPQTSPVYPDLNTIINQENAKRALEIAAAGGHHLMFIGPPGEGKTSLATRMPGILSPPTKQEQVEIARIYSSAGLAAELHRDFRPFRAPYHTITPARMLGGGKNLRPGEVTLAHLGILFLDELAEFRSDVLTALHQPMEEHQVRVGGSAVANAVYPAQFQVIAATNPCPCGWLGDAKRKCNCTDGDIARYHRRLRGPLLDRFDLFSAVQPMHVAGIDTRRYGESSAQVRCRVTAARERQWARAPADYPAPWINARIPTNKLYESCCLDAAAESLVAKASHVMALSTRAVDKVLRVARTIADLAGEKRVGADEIHEALSFRQ